MKKKYIFNLKVKVKETDKDFGLGKGVLATCELTMKATKKERESNAFQMALFEQSQRFLNEIMEVTVEEKKRNANKS